MLGSTKARLRDSSIDARQTHTPLLPLSAVIDPADPETTFDALGDEPSGYPNMNTPLIASEPCEVFEMQMKLSEEEEAS